ncbi:MAG: c-type cytochrome [Pirellulales bacterium]
MRRKSEQAIAKQLQNKEDVVSVVPTASAMGLAKLDVGMKPTVALLESADVTPKPKSNWPAPCLSDGGARYLLAQAKAGTLPAAVRLVVGAKLRSSNNGEIKAAAAELFPLPKSASKEPLPPLNELAQRKGDGGRGTEVFKTKGTCANCHVVSGTGKNVGPDLSEIGSKLSREAMLVSILDPSAGISHNFEQFSAVTDSGQAINGLLVSQNEKQVVLKDAQGIERTIPKDELVQLKKLDKSLMPDNLHEALSTDELVNLVEYLMSLKKK